MTTLLDQINKLPQSTREAMHVPPELESITRPKSEPTPSEKLADSQEQFRRNKNFTTYASADLGTLAGTTTAAGTTPLFPDGVHLPEDADITSVYVENNGTTATIGLCLGPSGSYNTRNFAPVKPGEGKIFAIPDGVRNISLYASVNNDTGLIPVVITTRRWAPKTTTL